MGSVDALWYGHHEEIDGVNPGNVMSTPYRIRARPQRAPQEQLWHRFEALAPNLVLSWHDQDDCLDSSRFVGGLTIAQFPEDRNKRWIFATIDVKYMRVLLNTESTPAERLQATVTMASVVRAFQPLSGLKSRANHPQIIIVMPRTHGEIL